ncbi:hypothetical protein WJX81_008661 [Elliptochloris bilobata]|uniref:J domain-containing protein n=1 Tax=Elliptochloris bilobata TaxID=381761 RepID=A0AAW1S030_9CHLO
MAEEPQGNGQLFAVFFLSIYSLFVIPYTIYKLCHAASPDEVVKPWEARKQSVLQRFVAKFFTPSNFLLALLWVAWLGIVVYVQSHAQESAPFDPFEILQVERGASDKDVRRAYRQLSLTYHPDKNPDPAAHKYFAESITKAYKALTDDVARENYEKYGHPDGPQSVKLDIALPDWVFSQDKKSAPLKLALLVGCGIMLPLGVAAWFLFRTQKYHGPNNVAQETLDIFCRSKFAVKESQSLARVPDTLVFAFEFIMLPTPNEQAGDLETLRRTILRLHPDLKEKPHFWKRKPSIVKVHMLLLAHLARAEVPRSLQADLRFMLAKAPLLLEEMVKIANLPRPPAGYGWLSPTVGSLEMMQCITRAQQLHVRKTLFHGGKAAADSNAPLLQLPHVDYELTKKLSRKRVRSLADLAAMAPDKRLAMLSSVGLTAAQAEEVATALSALPTINLAGVTCLVDGEEGEEISENDIVTCATCLTLTRASHALPDSGAPLGKGVLAYAPTFPFQRKERWYIILADPLSNSVYSWEALDLVEAEAAGWRMADSQRRAAAEGRAASSKVFTPSAVPAPGGNGDGGELSAAAPAPAAEPSGRGGAASGGNAQGGSHAGNGHGALVAADQGKGLQGQVVKLQMRAPKAGKYDLVLYCISDCWVGCDRALPVKLRVAERSRAEREGRAGGVRGAAAAEGASDEEVAARALAAQDGDRDSDADEDAEDNEDEGEWDSEETGSEESGSDGEAEEDKDEGSEPPPPRTPPLVPSGSGDEAVPPLGD